MNGRRFESCYAELLGIVAFIVAWRTYPHTDIDAEHIRLMLSTAVGIGGIAVGFLATALAILLAAGDAPPVRQFRRNKHGRFRDVVQLNHRAIVYTLLLAVLSGAGVVIDHTGNDGWHRFGAALWLGLAAASVAAVYRFIRILASLLRQLATT